MWIWNSSRTTPPYKDSRGEGVVKIIPDKGPEILKILIKKYLVDKESTLSKFLLSHSKNEIVIEITQKNMSLWLFKTHEGNLVMNDDGCPTCVQKILA